MSGAGCVEEPSHPPVARIQVSPDYIPKDDSFITSVTLSGKKSADPFDDPRGEGKLTYEWALPADARIESGSVTGPELVLKLAGKEPTVITLTVTDASGESATASTTVGIVIPRL